MSTLEYLQRSFAAAVFDAEAEIPAGLIRKSGGIPRRRFDVYRNNTYVSLIEVLADRFPVVVRLVGEDFFRAMARDHVERHPPKSPVLLSYGAEFPGFIAGFPPAAGVPYLADVAALEWAWHEAYHAAEASPLPLEELAKATGNAAGAVLLLHPSLRLVTSPYPVVSIWEWHGAGDETAPIKLDGSGEDALVVRPDMNVEIRRLPPGAVPFIRALGQRRSILEAFACAKEEVPRFDLQGNLAGLMGGGAIVGIEPKGATEPRAGQMRF